MIMVNVILFNGKKNLNLYPDFLILLLLDKK